MTLLGSFSNGQDLFVEQVEHGLAIAITDSNGTVGELVLSPAMLCLLDNYRTFSPITLELQLYGAQNNAFRNLAK